MLCFDIRSLEARAESVDDVLAGDDPVWEEDDTRPVRTGVHVAGRLSSAGAGRFYFSGRLAGAAMTSCRRCLTDVEAPVSEEMQLLFAESNLDVAEENDVIPIPANERELDMRPAIREEWLLSVPAFALCRDDCKGLCPSCGADRNSGECACAPATDPRWEALRGLRGEP
jgi:uncharacterized protein